MHTYPLLQSWYCTQRTLKMSSEQLHQYRLKLWGRLQPAIFRTPALSSLSGCELNEFPIITPTQIRGDIANWNSLGINNTEAFNAAENAEKGDNGEIIPGVIAGYSTGTSGKKGLFIASEKERSIYLGQNIAKLLSIKSILSGTRIMLFLRANSRLYSDSQKSKLVKFNYCSLSLDAQEKLKAVEDFKPTILIAPSHVLFELARTGYKNSSLARCFYGAEPMGDDERSWIEQKIGTRPDPIYQATEGFLGFSCKYGRLHLNEDSLNIEFEPVTGTNGYQIIVTDLHRTTQPIIRVKLDDFIELDNTPCKCGFSGQTILPVSGRVQDIWRLQKNIITPRQITETIEKSIGASKKWSAIASNHSVKLLLENSVSNDLAQNTARKLSTTLKLECPVQIESIASLTPENKRQRVKWRAEN